KRFPRGGEENLTVRIGTHGFGTGSFVSLEYDRVPEGIHPRAEIVFAGKTPAEPPVRLTVSLTDRCCSYNFSGPVRVPAEARPGKARGTVSFPDWTVGKVEAITYEIEVVEKQPKPAP